MNHKVIVLAAISMMSVSVFAAEPYEGKWAADKDWCRNSLWSSENPDATDQAPTDQVPISITRDGFEGLENACRFASIKQMKGTWIADANCFAEGDTYRQVIRIHVSGDVLTLSGDGEKGVTFVRCPQ